jgi:hypothetical protein
VTESGRRRPILAFAAPDALFVDVLPEPFEQAVRVSAVARIAADTMTALLVAIFIEKPPIRSRRRWRLG